MYIKRAKEVLKRILGTSELILLILEKSDPNLTAYFIIDRKLYIQVNLVRYAYTNFANDFSKSRYTISIYLLE